MKKLVATTILSVATLALGVNVARAPTQTGIPELAAAAASMATRGAGQDKPLFVQTLPAALTSREKEKAGLEEREKSEKLKIDLESLRYSGEVARDTNRMFWATLAMFVVTFLLFAAAVCQARYSRQAVGAATRSADAALGAVDIARDTAEKQLRAYVMMTDDLPVSLKNGILHAHFRMRNLGQTPAHDVLSRMHFEVVPVPIVMPETSESHGSRGFLGPTEERFQDISLNKPLARDMQVALDAGQLALVVNGFITYQDIFEKTRTTEYCYVCLPPVGPGSVFATHTTGNRAT